MAVTLVWPTVIAGGVMGTTILHVLAAVVSAACIPASEAAREGDIHQNILHIGSARSLFGLIDQCILQAAPLAAHH